MSPVVVSDLLYRRYSSRFNKNQQKWRCLLIQDVGLRTERRRSESVLLESENQVTIPEKCRAERSFVSVVQISGNDGGWVASCSTSVRFYFIVATLNCGYF